MTSPTRPGCSCCGCRLKRCSLSPQGRRRTAAELAAHPPDLLHHKALSNTFPPVPWASVVMFIDISLLLLSSSSSPSLLLLLLFLLLVTCCWKQLLSLDALQIRQRVSEVRLQGLLLCCRLGLGSAKAQQGFSVLTTKTAADCLLQVQEQTAFGVDSVPYYAGQNPGSLCRQRLCHLRRTQGSVCTATMFNVCCHTVSLHLFTHIKIET